MADAQTTTSHCYVQLTLSVFCLDTSEEWANTPVDDVSITRVSGRLINTLHLIWRNNAAVIEPAAVLIRHFSHAEEISDLEEPEEPAGDSITLSATNQAIIHWEMGPRVWGPNIHGLFEGCHLEEYIDAHSLTASECTQPEIARDVARSYARTHSIRL